ncbi:MAG: hypothetical protein QM523_01755 [Candidatus Pacebacteria bacterium]|nr:hypothetical protein [Candidatus Paceibacterota bacterium]
MTKICQIFTIAIVAVVMVFGFSPTARADEAIEKATFDACLPKAEAGDAECQNIVGLSYEKGNGVPKDYSQAAAWYRKAADQGNPYSQKNLGDLYYSGNGVEQDYAQAIIWYRKAAEQGYIYGAQNKLGDMYFDGKGVARDYGLAIIWYRKVGDHSNAYAQYRIGRMYNLGTGVPQDYDEAITWYRKAAEQGNGAAEYYLGFMYLNGQGVVKDLITAEKYFKSAQAKNISEAVPYLKQIAEEKKQRIAEEKMAEKQRLEALKAFNAIRVKADKGDAKAMVAVGSIYLTGNPAVTQDFTNAMSYFKQAVAKGNIDAYRFTGRMYEKGLGVPASCEVANQYYQKAANKDDNWAIEAIGKCNKIIANNAYQKGYEAGKKVGYEAGTESGFNRGVAVGYNNGYGSGKAAGYNSGYGNGQSAANWTNFWNQ